MKNNDRFPMLDIKNFPRAICLLVSSVLLPACTTATQTEIRENDSVLEKFNKASYNLTEVADQYVLKPVAKGYTRVLPDPLEDSFSRAFANIREVGTAANELLQGEFGQACAATTRVVINSTLGILGLFDVAETIGVRKNEPEDFGQTLAVWGIKSGPYLFIPFMGPSTLRDAPSRVVDYFFDPVNYVESSRDQYLLTGWDVIQKRAQLLQSEDLVSGDRYLFLKDSYLQRREYLVNDGELSEDMNEFDTDF
ncbi:MAG: VacJ family lipoprotein [Porticoccaceae bacterium]